MISDLYLSIIYLQYFCIECITIVWNFQTYEISRVVFLVRKLRIWLTLIVFILQTINRKDDAFDVTNHKAASTTAGTLPQIDLKGHTIEELAAVANVSVAAIKKAIELRQKQLMIERDEMIRNKTLQEELKRDEMIAKQLAMYQQEHQKFLATSTTEAPTTASTTTTTTTTVRPTTARKTTRVPVPPKIIGKVPATLAQSKVFHFIVLSRILFDISISKIVRSNYHLSIFAQIIK